jgi:drug/metabolite transporter (DMT)-like permease
MTNKKALKADLLLLLTAAIWGFAFVAQRAGMAFIGPFIFNAIRFCLGSFCLLPIIALNKRSETKKDKNLLWDGVLAGLVLFLASSFQQFGLVHTTAGKAGFITGLYVVILPLLALIWGFKSSLRTWIGAILAGIGLFLLSVTSKLTLAPGDGLVAIGAFMWAVHVNLIGKFTQVNDPIKLAFVQFAVCSILSCIGAAIYESSTMGEIYRAGIPLLYGGFMSVGTAFTLQVVAQRDAKPAHAAIIMSLESAFAVLGGWLILHETLSMRGIFGCILMLSGMLVSQEVRRRKP